MRLVQYFLRQVITLQTIFVILAGVLALTFSLVIDVNAQTKRSTNNSKSSQNKKPKKASDTPAAKENSEYIYANSRGWLQVGRDYAENYKALVLILLSPTDSELAPEYIVARVGKYLNTNHNIPVKFIIVKLEGRVTEEIVILCNRDLWDSDIKNLKQVLEEEVGPIEQFKAAQTKSSESVVGTVWVDEDESKYTFGQQKFTYTSSVLGYVVDEECEGNFKQNGNYVEMRCPALELYMRAIIKGDKMKIEISSLRSKEIDKVTAKKKE